MHTSILARSARLLPLCVSFLAVGYASAAQPVPPAATAVVRPPVAALAERRAVISGLTEPLENLKIVDLAGRDISGQAKARTEGGKVTVDFAHDKSIVLKPKTISTLAVPTGARMTLPGGVIVPHALPPTPAVAQKSNWFRLTFAASPMPAPWDDPTHGYITNLTFGLKRPDDAPATLSLGEPVIVKVNYQGLTAADSISLTIEGAGLEHEKTVALHFNPQSAKPTLLVRSSISDVNLELTALPRLDLQPAQKDIVGLGLEVVSVAIANVQPDGRSQAVARETPVTVKLDGRARVGSAPLPIKVGEANTSFTVRSSGLGPVAITATADGVTGAVTIAQHFPTGPLVAVLLGGAMGGFARSFIKGSRRATTGRRVLEGVVVGSVAFVAGVLGVGYLGLPAVIVATEAGAFLTGALAGFAGVSVMDLLAKKSSGA